MYLYACCVLIAPFVIAFVRAQCRYAYSCLRHYESRRRYVLVWVLWRWFFIARPIGACVCRCINRCVDSYRSSASLSICCMFARIEVRRCRLFIRKIIIRYEIRRWQKYARDHAP